MADAKVRQDDDIVYLRPLFNLLPTADDARTASTRMQVIILEASIPPNTRGNKRRSKTVNIQPRVPFRRARARKTRLEDFLSECPNQHQDLHASLPSSCSTTQQPTKQKVKVHSSVTGLKFERPRQLMCHSFCLAVQKGNNGLVSHLLLCLTTRTPLAALD